MVRDIMIDRRVDGAGAESVGDSEQKQHPVAAAEGESQKAQYRQAYGHDHDPLGVDFPDQARAEQRGDDGHAGDGHGHIARVGRWYAEGGLHDRPAGAEQRVRQPQANEDEIDDG